MPCEVGGGTHGAGLVDGGVDQGLDSRGRGQGRVGLAGKGWVGTHRTGAGLVDGGQESGARASVPGGVSGRGTGRVQGLRFRGGRW